MKINEVEAQVGVTKKNIRFYEEQGLLSPRRDSSNGYRDYGPEEVEALRRIKLLRKLGVSLEEIRRMQAGGTVGDGMRRHLIALEREQRDLEQSIALCRRLTEREERLDALEDAAALLEEMEAMERTGATFKDKQTGDVKTMRYAAPVIAALLMTVLMAAAIALMVWAFIQDPADAPPLPLVAVFIAVPAVVILGVLLALFQRIREIQKGEEDDAKNYYGQGLCRGGGRHRPHRRLHVPDRRSHAGRVFRWVRRVLRRRRDPALRAPLSGRRGGGRPGPVSAVAGDQGRGRG